jgi:hypothetical protein
VKTKTKSVCESEREREGNREMKKRRESEREREREGVKEIYVYKSFCLHCPCCNQIHAVTAKKVLSSEIGLKGEKWTMLLLTLRRPRKKLQPKK